MQHLPKHKKIEILSIQGEDLVKSIYEDCSFIITGDNIIVMTYGDDNTMVGTPYKIDNVKSYKVYENDIEKNQLNG